MSISDTTMIVHLSLRLYNAQLVTDLGSRRPFKQDPTDSCFQFIFFKMKMFKNLMYLKSELTVFLLVLSSFIFQDSIVIA